MPLMDESIGQLEGFPAGMRVLAVDDDSVVLRSLELMLLKCGYKVTVSQHAFKALELLRAKKDDYDLVITDVNMPDMDGFKLLEIVGLEMDLPVIMLSVDCDVKSVMKGIMHGAVDYLAKPVRLEELKLIWKHVARKSLNEKKDQNDASNKLDHAETPEQVSKLYSSKNGKIHNKERDNEDSADSDEDMARQKKPRIAWTPELHAKFINVVNHLGINRAVPKKILDMMNISGLTRENVASHLQKYRKGLKKNAMELRQQLLNNPGSSLSMAANQQRTAIYAFERSCVDYRIKSDPRQSCNGYSQAASAWLPRSLGHQDNKFCQRYMMNSLAGQLETKQLGFAAANPYSTKASSQFLNYQSFALRPNQPDSNAETSQNALASGMDSELNHRSNQFECNASSSGMNSVFHPAHASGNQTIDMLELDSFMESEHEQQQNFVSCLGEAAGTLEDINWDSLDVQSCSFEDQMGSGPPDFAVCPAEQFPAEMQFAFNKAEHTEDLHAALKQFQR